MSDMERNVAGLACRQVLALLSDYLDGDLAREEVVRIEAHLAGCDWCERFGGGVGHVVGALRRELSRAAPLPRDVAARLERRLASLA